jgi:hypothetical protein
MEQWWNDRQGKTKELKRKTCLSATLWTTNPTWTPLATYLGLCDEKLATNLLSKGMASLPTLRKPKNHF